MSLQRHTTVFCALVALAIAAATLGISPSAAARDKQTIWNYDGGILLETEGSLANGICFRVAGRVTSGLFFDELKRIDDIGVDTVFRRGKDMVTQFPKQLLLQFTIYDIPCLTKLKPTGSRMYLTRAMVGEMHLSLFWKRGVELRPLTDFEPLDFSIRTIFPYDREARDLPEKLEWFYTLAIPSAGVPLTDSLVLIIRDPDSHVAARVAARL